MKLIVNGRFLRTRPTGMHRAARTLLHEARRQGLDFEVLAPPGVDDPLADRTVWGPPGRAGDHVWEQASLLSAAHGRPIVSLINTAPLASRRSVVWTHDLGPLVGPHWFRAEGRLYGWLLVQATRRASLVLVPSHQVREEVTALGVPPARIRVLRTALDPSFRPPPAGAVDTLRTRLDLQRPYVLQVGWADPRKDVITAAAAHLAAVRTHAHDLVLVGREHPIFAPVVAPQAPTIRQLGYVSDSDLPVLLAGAAALLFPSRYEGFGLPPAEAMACGTTALVSDLPSVRESTGGGATYLPPGDVDAWARAIRAALDGELDTPAPPAWSAPQMATQFVDALSAM